MKRAITLLLMLAIMSHLSAQDIQITKFERNYTSLIASVKPVYDNAGDACAVIRFFVRDKDFIIEPNLGVLKKEDLPGEIRLYVPRGTKRLTIRRQNHMPLNGYEIPLRIESKVTYDVELVLNNEATNGQKRNKGHNVYIGAGYNIASISGPSLAVGFDVNHHIIELGAVIGLNKTDDIYFYDSSSSVKAAYNYKAIRTQLRYGYDIEVADFFSVQPQVGFAYNYYSGTEVVKGKSDYGSASSMSGMIGARLVASLSDQFKIHITPEYDFGIYKDDNCKKLSDFDNSFKSWTDGFNLNIGLIYKF